MYLIQNPDSTFIVRNRRDFDCLLPYSKVNVTHSQKNDRAYYPAMVKKMGNHRYEFTHPAENNGQIVFAGFSTDDIHVHFSQEGGIYVPQRHALLLSFNRPDSIEHKFRKWNSDPLREEDYKEVVRLT